jgi:hypothetical protein
VSSELPEWVNQIATQLTVEVLVCDTLADALKVKKWLREVLPGRTFYVAGVIPTRQQLIFALDSLQKDA